MEDHRFSLNYAKLASFLTLVNELLGIARLPPGMIFFLIQKTKNKEKKKKNKNNN